MKDAATNAHAASVHPPLSTAKPRRALALDALRGFAILTMVLSGVVPWTGLPAWMYHAQLPPPEHTFNPNLPGLTWVDLVFPFFLFAMGAAFPLALSRRIQKGLSKPRIVLGILERGFLLGTFGIFLDHIRPYSMNGNPETGTWLLALLGFILLCLMYTRFPSTWPSAGRWGLKAAGWGGAVLFLTFYWALPEARAFDPNRRDIIIIILTNVAVFGSLVWLLTRESWLFRLAVMGGVVALRLSSSAADSWISTVWNANPFPAASDYSFPLSILVAIPHVIHIGMNSYLLIVLPGAIAGDLLLRWMKDPPEEHARLGNWSVARLWGIAALMLGFILVCLVGLQARTVLEDGVARRYLFETTVACAVLAALGGVLSSNPGNRTERFLCTLFHWGAAWLFIGLLFEPYEGGIKKDPATFGYFFITAGLSFFLLTFFLIAIDVRRQEKGFGILVANGQNPMIAYVANGNLLMPLMNLTLIGGVIDRLTPGPWLGTLRALFVTFLVALIVWAFTKKRIFWRT